VKDAERYRGGEWENEGGWVTLDQPLFVDLTAFEMPPLRREQRMFFAAASVMRWRPRDPGEDGWQEYGTGLVRTYLATHKKEWETFNDEAYFQFLQRQWASVEFTEYVKDEVFAGLSINFAYWEERLVVSQLFAWDKQSNRRHRLGAVDYLLQAAWYRSLGFELMALGPTAPYKRDLFRRCLCDPS